MVRQNTGWRLIVDSEVARLVKLAAHRPRRPDASGARRALAGAVQPPALRAHVPCPVGARALRCADHARAPGRRCDPGGRRRAARAAGCRVRARADARSAGSCRRRAAAARARRAGARGRRRGGVRARRRRRPLRRRATRARGPVAAPRGPSTIAASDFDEPSPSSPPIHCRKPRICAPARCATTSRDACSTIPSSTTTSLDPEQAYLTGQRAALTRAHLRADRARRRGSRGGDRDGRPRRRPDRRADARRRAPTATSRCCWPSTLRPGRGAEPSSQRPSCTGWYGGWRRSTGRTGVAARASLAPRLRSWTPRSSGSWRCG